MHTAESLTAATDTARTPIPRSALGSRLLLAGSAIYAAAAVAPFTQGIFVGNPTTTIASDGSSVVSGGGTSYWGEGAFDFIWSWGGWGPGNGGMMRYLQALTVLAMALVAVGALLRLRRGGSQRSITSVVATAVVSLLLVRVWLDVSNVPDETIEASGTVLEAFRFTPSLLVASVAAVVATVGAVMASLRPRPGGGRT